MPNLNEYYADINTFLTYQFNEHWAVQSGIHLRGLRHDQSVPNALPAGNHCGRARRAANQTYNTLDGFYTNATAHVVQGFLQYKF